MLVVGGILVGGAWSLWRQKHPWGTAILGLAAVVAFAAAWAWGQR
jgi:hypothetical protein